MMLVFACACTPLAELTTDEFEMLTAFMPLVELDTPAIPA